MVSLSYYRRIVCRKIRAIFAVFHGSLFGVRHVQMLLLFLMVTIGYSMRVNLTVSIVAMLNNSTNPNFPTYDWKEKDIILSSFFWGYVIPQIGAGQLAETFGPKWILVGAMCTCSTFTMLLPAMAKLGAYGVVACRIVQGLSQGFFFPCAHHLISKWVPLSERSRLGTFVYSGGPFGTVIAMPLSGWICASSLGWPSVFYIFGSVGFAWAIAYAIWGSNSVEEHKCITDDEKIMIQDSKETNELRMKVPTPWVKIATSVPVWAILITHCGQNWGFWTLLTEISSYMNGVLNYDIKANGLLSALPYFVLWIFSFCFSAISDGLINTKACSVGATRKIMTTIGLVCPAFALFGLGILGETDRFTCIVLLVLAVGLNSGTYCGYQVNHIDLAPNHAGTLMGITNGIANTFSIIAPLAVQYIVLDSSDVNQWKYIWYLAALIYTICALVYIVLGSGEKQSWDKDSEFELDEIQNGTNK